MSTKTNISETARAAALLADDPSVGTEVDREIRYSRVVSHLLSMRVSKGLTQEQVARAMGCDASKISRLESGNDGSLRWMDIVGYAHALNADIRLSFEDRDLPAAEKIKQCVFGIDDGLKQLAILAKNLGADDEITQKIHSFYAEVLFNFLVRYQDSADSIGLTIRVPAWSEKNRQAGDSDSGEKLPDKEHVGELQTA
ncbi:putative transcriptional regulator [Opitutaceae bacterium TAV1]|nr:putative transcriptional regulator [Opitutaceae bacterium TAV1]